MKTRDPQLIQKDMRIADLSASNCALQGGELLTRIQLFQRLVEECKRNQVMFDAQKAALETELKEALAERAVTGQPSKPIVPLELVVNGTPVQPVADASPSSTEPAPA